MSQESTNNLTLSTNHKLVDLKPKLKTKFEAEGFPTTSHENWLYWAPDQLHQTLLNPVRNDDYNSDTFADVTIVNGSLVNVSDKIQGLEIFETESTELLANLDLNLDTSSISILNSLQAEKIIVLKAASNLEQLIRVSNISTANNPNSTAVAKIIVLAEQETVSKFIFDHISLFGNTNAINTSFHLIAKKDSNVSITHLFKKVQSPCFFHSMIYLYENTNCDHLTYVTNSELVRHDTEAHFYEENANLKCSGVGILKNNEQFYNHLKINHYVKNCNCEQFFKNILDDQAIAEFSGLVFVKEGAHGVDSTQSNKTLLLSDKARVLSRPQLKIDADDVQCAHGSTIGQLNPEEVFYITSRGLSLKEAKALLVYGFAEEIIVDIEDQSLRTELVKDIKNTLREINI